MVLPKRTKVVLIFTLIMMAVSAIVAFAAPGDSSDPLITLSYITETLVPEIDAKIDQEVIKKVDEAMDNHHSNEGGSSSFVLVNVKANQKIIGDEGTEFVVRAGEGTILATQNGGVADLTSGVDLPSGTAIPLNHHLLSPRDDSRGLHFTTSGIVMIKGKYSVKTK